MDVRSCVTNTIPTPALPLKGRALHFASLEEEGFQFRGLSLMLAPGCGEGTVHAVKRPPTHQADKAG